MFVRFRYPGCEFDADDEKYSCPACEGFCNCTVCCRKRDEPYVSGRICDEVPDSPPLPPQRPRKTNVVGRVKLGSKTNLSVPTKAIPTTTIPTGVTQAWGSLYSVTGEKIGACFFDPSAEKDTSIVFAPVTTPFMTTITDVAQPPVAAAVPKDQAKIQVKTKKKKEKKKRRRRIFVGMVQPCWGYSKPTTKLLRSEPYAKRSYNAMPRYYVGKKKYLFYPIEDDESSLTSLDEDEGAEVQKPDGTDLEGKKKSFLFACHLFFFN